MPNATADIVKILKSIISRLGPYRDSSSYKVYIDNVKKLLSDELNALLYSYCKSLNLEYVDARQNVMIGENNFNNINVDAVKTSGEIIKMVEDDFEKKFLYPVLVDIKNIGDESIKALQQENTFSMFGYPILDRKGKPNGELIDTMSVLLSDDELIKTLREMKTRINSFDTDQNIEIQESQDGGLSIFINNSECSKLLETAMKNKDLLSEYVLLRARLGMCERAKDDLIKNEEEVERLGNDISDYYKKSLLLKESVPLREKVALKIKTDLRLKMVRNQLVSLGLGGVVQNIDRERTTATGIVENAEEVIADRLKQNTLSTFYNEYQENNVKVNKADTDPNDLKKQTYVINKIQSLMKNSPDVGMKIKRMYEKYPDDFKMLLNMLDGTSNNRSFCALVSLCLIRRLVDFDKNLNKNMDTAYGSQLKWQDIQILLKQCFNAGLDVNKLNSEITQLIQNSVDVAKQRSQIKEMEEELEMPAIRRA